ncbi:ataxin-10 [Spea bombifrons]|uniref:ataxin-10 n=1 Tax=Spea bombifrons TaxID=233779 RepID=UPI002349AABB|nr:ataxin-10 [Spea bombifrons]
MAAPTERLASVCAELETWLQEGWDRGDPGLELLQRLTDMFRDPACRELAEDGVFKVILATLSRASHRIDTAEVGADALENSFLLVAECFRCLRNSCVRCSQNQDAIRNVGLIEESVGLIKSFSSYDDIQEPGLVALRCGLQFLGNAAAGNPDSQNSIWKRAFPELFLNCLRSADDKVCGFSSMILYTCMSDDKMGDLLENADVALGVFTAYGRQQDADWLHLIVTDRFLKSPDLVKTLYPKQTDPERITLLEIILDKVTEKEPTCAEESTSLRTIGEFLSERFQNQCRAVLKLIAPGDSDEQEALVVVRLLDVLCEMTSNNEYLAGLQSCTSLLETVIDVLRLTHLAGKQTKNIFTSAHTSTLGTDLTHAVVGFKAHLIRMIANLCYRHTENQDKVHRLDGIPLILDNCSIDDNNPFLNQWAVYAIRNLTENNEKNQDLIASMERQGLADTSLLKSMGFDVQERDGKLVLKSTKKS